MQGDGIFRPEDQNRAVDVRRRSLASGRSSEIEPCLRHHSGDHPRPLGRTLPLRRKDSRIAPLMGAGTDVDDLRRATDDHKCVSALVQLFSDATPDMICDIDCESRMV